MSEPIVPFDPELGILFKSAPPELQKSLTLETLPPLVAAYSKAPPVEDFIGSRPLTYQDFKIPGHNGDEIEVTVFHRKDHVVSDKPTQPGFIHYHGGGMMMGHRLLAAEFLLPWVEQYDGVLACVEYRLAPAHPSPTPVEDAYASLVWFTKQGLKLGFDAERIMLEGHSAGAGITAGVSLLARDRGLTPKVKWQLLGAPMLDDRNKTVSSRQFTGEICVWNAVSNQVGWSSLLGHADDPDFRRARDDINIYSAPARHPDLSGLPITYLEVGSAEVFRDEVVEFASRIWAAGGSADLHVWHGGFHSFESWATSRLSQEAMAGRNSWARRQLEWDPVKGAYEKPL
ncbi:hypothetical protein DHEL01_v200227 [Diaporthe helianthi]|uniref:Alpha/beta hydrolase fold-3 domain-containing protein n=1 Tax=Diaporthe helianthi TaxID=158607 RepID=A0A2P5IFX1_DIAHE|nr:hypothetical protein DHEL01_v200227 [Diaporthe helianthi]